MGESEALKREIYTIQESKAAVLLTLKKKETELSNLQKAKAASISKLEELVSSLQKELNDAHANTKNELESNKKILHLKSKLISLMDKMNSDNLSASTLPPEIENLKQELQTYLKRNSELESEILALKSELETKKIEYTQLKVSQTIREADSLDLNDEIPTSLPDAMDKVRDEIAETNIAIEEANFKMPSIQNEGTYAECANISADLIVRLAELEVSRANLLSNIPFNSLQESPDLVNIRNDLSDARRNLFNIIRDLDFDASFWQNEVYTNDQPVAAYSQDGQFQVMSPLKLDGAQNGLGIDITQNAPQNVSPEVHASQVIAENVIEMKTVLDQFKQIISAEPSRRESMNTAHRKSLREEPSLSQAVLPAVEKWNPPLQQSVVPWSKRQKETPVISDLLKCIELIWIFIFHRYHDHFIDYFRPLCVSICIMLAQFIQTCITVPSFVNSPQVHLVCSTFVLPAWEKISDVGHSNVEYLVLDFLPNIYMKASHGTEWFLKFNGKSFDALKKNIFSKDSTQDKQLHTLGSNEEKQISAEGKVSSHHESLNTAFTQSEQTATSETDAFKSRRNRLHKYSQDVETSAESTTDAQLSSDTEQKIETGISSSETVKDSTSTAEPSDEILENLIDSEDALESANLASADTIYSLDDNVETTSIIASGETIFEVNSSIGSVANVDTESNESIAESLTAIVETYSTEESESSETVSPVVSVEAYSFAEDDIIGEEDLALTDNVEETESRDLPSSAQTEETDSSEVLDDSGSKESNENIPNEEDYSSSAVQESPEETLAKETLKSSPVILQEDNDDKENGFTIEEEDDGYIYEKDENGEYIYEDDTNEDAYPT